MTLVELRSPIDKETLNRLLDNKDEAIREAASLMYTLLEPHQPKSVESAADNIIHIDQARRSKGGAGARGKRQPRT